MSTMASNYRKEYSFLWDTMVIDPKRKADVNKLVAKAKANKPIYLDIIDTLKKNNPIMTSQGKINIPWQFLACVHYMECGFSFKHHLHNGDPLTHKTVRVPKGRPVRGDAPFTFKESALDALVYQDLHEEMDWSVPNMLYKLEAYNGYGYRSKGINSPYLWSFSNHYTKGKYVADHKYSATAVSTQCGSALILKQIL